MAWYASLYTTFMHTIDLSSLHTGRCWVPMLVCVRVSQHSDSHCSVHSLSFSHTCTHSLYCNVNLSSHIHFYLTEKLLGALLFLLTQMGEMPAHTHHSLSSSPFIFLLGRGVMKSCGWRLNLEEVIMTSESVCVFRFLSGGAASLGSPVSWPTASENLSEHWSRRLHHAGSPVVGTHSHILVYIMHIQNTFLILFCFFF